MTYLEVVLSFDSYFCLTMLPECLLCKGWKEYEAEDHYSKFLIRSISFTIFRHFGVLNSWTSVYELQQNNQHDLCLIATWNRLYFLWVPEKVSSCWAIPSGVIFSSDTEVFLNESSSTPACAKANVISTQLKFI